MFRLEKLEISGFKSFADRTSLLFGEGITGIVGPNGCGKSNVAEAISWVLGEQSAKSLRGGKMEDVIFNGTRDRKPIGMSEVVLTLVATRDIASREEEVKDDEKEYEVALMKAEHADQAARSLVEGENKAAGQGPAEQAAAQDQPSLEAQPQPGGQVSQSPEEGAIATEPQAAGEQAASESGAFGHQAAVAARRRKRKTIAVSAGERITVGRRLYRTGDSDYLMNGRPCLLRDIQDLFAGTGLGGAHYAIIEQGRIGQILSSKPLDRRALIEEAAGITKFKSRKRATELRLESAKQNLMRLNDIISEIERQVNSLKRQAQKARRYRRLREELRQLMKLVFTADYYRLNESAARVAGELEQAEVRRAETEALLAERETEHRVVSGEARAAEERLALLREQAAGLELEADRARNRRAFEEQQMKELSARIEELERDQKSLEGRLDLLDEEAQRRSADLKRLETGLSFEQADLLQREGEYQAELARLRAAEGEIEQLRQRVLMEIGATERVRNLGANLEDALRRIDLKQANLRSELERAASRRDDASGEHARVSKEVEGFRARLDELTTSINERGATLISVRQETITVRSELESIQRERAATEHRLASLEDLDAHRAYYSDTVQQVLSPEQAARINALGTLADFVEVEAQYERLIESLFGRELQCVLVPTIDDALAGVDYIKSEELGRGAFLVVGLHGGEGDPSDYLLDSTGEGDNEGDRSGSEDAAEEFRFTPRDGFASADAMSAQRFDEEEQREAARFQLDVLRAIDLLSLRPEIKTVVERAFPDKCVASVVPDIEAALQLSIENASRIYVTYEGEQVVNGRLVVTGAQAGRKGTSLLGLKREIKQLRAQTEMFLAEEQRLAAELGRAQRRLEEIENEATSLDREIREHEKAIAARVSEREGLARDLERAQQHVRVVEAELQQSTDERRELEDRVAQLSVELSAAEASQSAAQESLATAQAALVEMRTGVEGFAEQLSTSRASVAARLERLQAARAEIRRIDNEVEELRGRINRNRLELYESHGRIEQLSASQAEGETAAGRFASARASLVGQINAEAEALRFARSRSDELESLLAQIRREAAEIRERRAQSEVERARIESEAEHLTRTCFSELAMPLEEVVTSFELGQAAGRQLSNTAEPSVDDDGAQSVQEAPEPAKQAAGPDEQGKVDIAEARARLDELRVKLDEMGPVNMMALEELEEAEQRFTFLSEQRRDILDSIRMTEEALGEIKRRSRERFRHAFTHINKNFQNMFVELFGGGRGEMILIDEEDVLESGVDLIAQPPGKRLQNVLLLSGGEKAMAAISLVLAIFQYRPSPFCILDEVDAPLDEMNVKRFSDKVIEMSGETQFLVITHNKRTMEAARALYGVTMEEPGVSKLVSVKFE